MKTVNGKIISSKPISLSKAASSLSSFLSTDNGASQTICAYLRRASVAFNELKQLHKDLRPSKSDHNLKNSNRSENKKSPVSESRSKKKRREIVDNNDLIDGKLIGNVRFDQESSREHGKEDAKDGKKMMVNGGTGDFEDVVDEDGKGRDGLKIDIGDNSDHRVDLDKESSGKKRKKHKNKSVDGIGKIGAIESDSRLGNCDDNGVGDHERIKIEPIETGRSNSVIENNVEMGKKHEDKEDDDVKVHEELLTKKKKKKKMGRDEGMPDLDGGASKREEAKKRKNHDVVEGGDGGSVEQQGKKRRKRNE